MKIGVIGWYGHQNAGDERILYCLRRFFEGQEFLVTSGFGDAAKRIDDLNRCDYVLLGGGGLILRGLNTYAELIEQMEPPLGCVGLGVEAYHDDNAAFVDALKAKAEFILVRDAESRELLQNHFKVIVSSDLAFLYPLDVVEPAESDTCGVNLRDWYFWKCEHGGEYYKHMMSLSRSNPDIEKEYPHCKWEPAKAFNIIKKKFSNLLAVPLCSENSPKADHVVLKSFFDNVDEAIFLPRIYNSLRYLIGMRLHSLIFACQSGIPFVSLSYQPKNERFCRALGLEKLSVGLFDLSELDSAISVVKDSYSQLREKLIFERDRAHADITSTMNEIRRLMTGRTAVGGISLEGPAECDCNFTDSSSSAPRVSVVLPTYNHLRFLPKAVESVLAQTFSDFELIIVNDGSTDGTQEYLDTLKDPRIRIIGQENKHLPEALNAGFRTARGELLTWISADNYCTPAFIEAFVTALDANPDVGFAYSAYAWMDENGQIVGKRENNDVSYHNLLAHNAGTASFMYRRICQKRVGLYDPGLVGAEDWDMWLRIIEQFQTVYVPEVLYYYRQHKGSMTERMPEEIRRVGREVFQKALKRRNYELDMTDLYPTFALCKDQEAARFYAYFDLGTALLQSSFAPAELAAQMLEGALSLSPDSLEAAGNLAVAYARSARWEKAIPLLGQMIKRAENPKALNLCRAVAEAHRMNNPDTLTSKLLFKTDKKSVELFQLEESRKRVFSFSDPDFHEEPAWPLVSVIIPCYNTADYLGEAIESVLAQTYGNFEVIVVDDGSTDNTPQVVRSFDDKRIRYVYQDNKGLPGARNTGIRHSKGQYLAFLDADDYFLPNKLTDQVAFLESHPDFGLVAGWHLRVDQNGRIIKECKSRSGEVSVEEQLVNNRFIIHSTLIRRDWVVRAGCFDESLHGAEEWDFHSRLAIAGCPMYRTNDCVCAYRFVPGSLSTDIECQLNGARQAAKKIFSSQDLSSELAELMPKVMGFKYVKAAIPSYALGRIDKGRQYLAAALTWDPCLCHNNYQRIINYLLFWFRHVRFNCPSHLVESVFDNLPAEAGGMLAMREETLHKLVQGGTTMSSLSVSGNAVINMDKADKDKIYERLNKCYFSEECHEKEVIEHLPEILNGARTFVDIGASLGQYTFYANKCMQGAQIFAIEANPIRFEELKRNCSKWELLSTNRLTPLFAAASDKDGRETFYVTNSPTTGALFKRDLSAGSVDWHPTTVDCVRLDSLFRDSSPDVVKIDVEGAELRVLKGATRILREGRTKFLIEVHGGADPKGQKDPEEVFRFMESFGYARLSFYGRSLFVNKVEANEETVEAKSEAVKITGLQTLANKYAGRRAFIIGNGPSLKSMDLTKLKNEITFGVNSIFYNFDKMGFKPTFYVVEDKLVAEDRAEEIKALTKMTKIFGTELQYCLAGSLETIWADVIYDFTDYPGFPNFSEDAAKCLWVGGTVSYLCMQLAYYMGFSEVYLVGFDHNYTVPDDAKIEGAVITSNSDDPNHFHPDYFGKGKRWHDPRTDRMELAYKRAKEIFERDGRKIYNATAGGKLEIFPRLDYERLFAGQKDLSALSSNRPSAVEEPSSGDTNSNHKVRISVVVCTHRNPTLLTQTLDSLTLQTLSKELYEVIVVDNNSQDNTKDVVDGYLSVRYVLEEKLGLSHARNTGVHKARGDIIAFIDDDAEASPGWLQALLNVYDSVPDAWAVGGKVLPIWDEKKPEWLTEEYYRCLSLLEWGQGTRALRWPERIIGTNCSFRREVFSVIGHFKPELGRIGDLLLSFEDTEIQQRIHETDHSVYYSPEATVYHHVPAFRMTAEYFCSRSLGNIVSQIFMTLSQRGKSDEVYQCVNRFRNIVNSGADQSNEPVEEQLLENVQSEFVLAHPDVPLETRVKFISMAARYYLLQEKYEKAEKKCVEGLALPSLSKAQICKLLLRLANVYLKQNKEEQAREKLYEALCTGPIAGEEAYQTFKALGEYYHQQGRYAQMKERADMIVASRDISEQNRVSAARYIAEFYSGCGMHDEAERLYMKFSPLDNLENASKDKLLLGLSELYKKQGRYAEAREVINKATLIENLIEQEKARSQSNSITVLNTGSEPPHVQKKKGLVEKPVALPTKPRFSHLVLDYTRLCNSRCTYCGIWKLKNAPELGLDSIEKTFAALRSFGLSTCYLTGGEPYISDKVVDIARLLHQYLPKCKISGATNGIQPKQIIRRMRKILDIGVPVEVHISINGREATHDSTRGGQGFWKKAVYLLETLKSCQVPVVVSMSLMPQTIADLPYMQEFCAERDIRLMYSWVRQCVRYCEVDEHYSTWPEELKPKLRQIEYLPDEFDCVGLSKRLVVTPDGSLYPCEVYHPDILLGNVNEESLESMLNSPRTASIMQMISNKGCHWCQGAGEIDGSPKWMLMDCYRRHSKQAICLAENFPQAITMPPQQSKQVIGNILSHKSFHQIPALIEQNDHQPIRDDNSKEQIRISVVVCTHRNPALLAKTLDSLGRQILPQELFEVIVVDNNSQDNTKEVVARYPMVRYVLEERLGLSNARNTGVEKARGDIIAFIDDDAEASPQWLQALLKIYDSIPDAWAVGGKVLPIWDSQKPDWLTDEYYRALSLVEWGESARALCWPERIIGTNCSFRRQVFTDIGFFDTCLGRIGTALLGNEDTEIQQRIHALGYLIYYAPEAVVYHHVTASRMTEEYFRRREQGTKISRAILELRSQGNNHQAEQIATEVRQSVGGMNASQKKREVPANLISSLRHDNEVSRHASDHRAQLTESERINLLYHQIRANSRRLLMQYKDKYRGQRCVILGNGPSLNNTDLSLLKNEYTFGLNKIYLLFDRIDWRPTFYVCVNPFVIQQSGQQILNDIPGLKFLDFVSFKYLPYNKDTVHLLSLNGKGFSTDPCEGVFQMHTVTYVAMQLAYYLGFDKVFLVGVDHFFNAANSGQPDQVVVQNDYDSDHFDPDYFAKGQQWNLPNLEGSEEGYRIAKTTFEKANKKIYDATVGGRLSVFERVDFYDVFGNTKNSNLYACTGSGQ